MRIIDLSQPLFDGCPNCPAHPPVRIEVIGRIPKRVRTTGTWSICRSPATRGVTSDAPLHKLRGGASLDAFGLEQWTGPRGWWTYGGGRQMRRSRRRC